MAIEEVSLSEVLPVWVVKLERVIDGDTVRQQELATFDMPLRIKNLNDGPRKYWGHLTALDRYIQQNSVMISNYHRRYHAGQRVSTALVESAVNSLVNHRMNKPGQMRWTLS